MKKYCVYMFNAGGKASKHFFEGENMKDARVIGLSVVASLNAAGSDFVFGGCGQVWKNN